MAIISECIFLGLGLVLIISLYFRLADKYNIIDKPNERSSHSLVTIRGGGIIFTIATLAGLIFENLNIHLLAFALGLLLIASISFIDDITTLSNKVRLAVHLIAVTLLLYSTAAFQLLPIWGIGLAYVIVIGTINAYNFMDGINGITGLYSLTILSSILFFSGLYEVNANGFHVLIAAIISCVVFLFYNFRKKAKCFAGDVGSVGIGFIILYFVLTLIITHQDYKYIFLLSVYGVDTVLTIIHRLSLRQNIFQAHRMHLYQYLANEMKISHLIVSSIYALIQLLINIFIFNTDYDFLTTGLLINVPLAIVYLLVKSWIIKRKLSPSISKN